MGAARCRWLKVDVGPWHQFRCDVDDARPTTSGLLGSKVPGIDGAFEGFPASGGRRRWSVRRSVEMLRHGRRAELAELMAPNSYFAQTARRPDHPEHRPVSRALRLCTFRGQAESASGRRFTAEQILGGVVHAAGFPGGGQAASVPGIWNGDIRPRSSLSTPSRTLQTSHSRPDAPVKRPKFSGFIFFRAFHCSGYHFTALYLLIQNNLIDPTLFPLVHCISSYAETCLNSWILHGCEDNAISRAIRKPPLVFTPVTLRRHLAQQAHEGLLIR